MDPFHVREIRDGGMAMLIPSEIESMWLFKVLWSIREVRLTIDQCPNNTISGGMHAVNIGLTTRWEQERHQIIEMLGWEPHGNLPLHVDNPSMMILVYNCLGAGDDDFTTCMRESQRMHSAGVVAILEHRVHSFGQQYFSDQFGLTRAKFVEALQHTGGVWLLWNPSRVMVTIIESNIQTVDAIISKPELPGWVSTIVYGSPRPTNKERLWGNLKFLLEQTGHPWTLAGGKLTHCDSDYQRKGGSRTGKLSESTNQCCLLDLEYNGPPFTGSKNRVMTTNLSTGQEHKLSPKSTIAYLSETDFNNSAMRMAIMVIIGSAGTGGLIRNKQGNSVGVIASSVAELQSQLIVPEQVKGS